MDLAPVATKNLKSAYRIFRQDLEALPEDAFDKRFADRTRTVADIVYEVNLVNDHVGMVMRGEEPFTWPEERWITAPAEIRTKAAVLASLDASSAKLIETVDGFSSEELEQTVQTEHGERTRFDRCNFVTLHLWYHSGQLNYIQTLLGDDAGHWN
jgi:hypothetical protein